MSNQSTDAVFRFIDPDRANQVEVDTKKEAESLQIIDPDQANKVEADTMKEAESMQTIEPDRANKVEADTMKEEESLQTMDSDRAPSLMVDESKNRIRELQEQQEELKRLADISSREIEELKQREAQQTLEIKRLNVKHADEIANLIAHNDDEHYGGGRYRGSEKQSYQKTSNDSDDYSKEAKKANNKLKERLKSMDSWNYGVGGLLLLMLIMIGILYTGLPCHSYINQIKDLTIQMNDLKTENIQLGRTSTSTRETLIKVQEEAEQMLKDKAGLMIQVDQEKEKSSRLDSKKTDLEKRVADLKQKINVDTDKLNVELDIVQTKLSKCQTVNDDSVTNSDLSPIKLGQDFRAIYEQHYTMAIDELEGIHGESDVKATVQMFLNILKTAHNLTDIYTGQHIESMKHSTTSVEIEIPEQKSQVKMNKVYVNGTLTRMDLKDFYEIRQKCALRMLDQMTIELGEVIARQFNVDSGSQPKMMTYIKQCVSLCWKTNMHREPVYIDFYEPYGTEKFDYERFKPFMYQSGNYIDFVVWPPMFERRGGHMVAKGIAERKD